MKRRQKETTNRTKASVVVLVESDESRENPTAPGGLRLYGKLAALGAGRPERFIDLYSALRNVDRETALPSVLQLYRPDIASPLTYLDAQIRTGDHETVVWEFRHPTRWELALAEWDRRSVRRRQDGAEQGQAGSGPGGEREDRPGEERTLRAGRRLDDRGHAGEDEEAVRCQRAPCEVEDQEAPSGRDAEER